MEFAVVFEWTGRNYSAYVPDLPGCIATAKSLDATEKLIREAIELYVEVMREKGQAPPQPTTKTALVQIAA